MSHLAAEIVSPIQIPLAGARKVYGFTGKVMGKLK